MVALRFRATLLLSAALLSGCELMVQLDRSAAPSEDAGCAICGEAGAEDAGEDSATEDSARPTPDATTDGPVLDAGDAGDAGDG
jgi:hypothetical protein